MTPRDFRGRLTDYADAITESLRRRGARQKPRIRVRWSDRTVRLIDVESERGRRLMDLQAAIVDAMGATEPEPDRITGRRPGSRRERRSGRSESERGRE